MTRARSALRLFVGLVLLATAAGKLLDVEGFARVLATYEAFPDWALRPLAVGIPVTELALAVWLFSGRGLAAAAGAALALHALYGVWAAATILRGRRIPNCGCFGVFFPRPLGWRTVAEDLVMIGVAAALVVLARRDT